MDYTTPAVVGIDAGGTCTRARAVANDSVIHDGVGGPGNPQAVSSAQLARSYEAALDGCPDPRVVAVCAAGTGDDDGRRRVERVLQERFPGAEVRVTPDYVAALMAAGPDVDLVVVAGAGSVVCSRSGQGRLANVSGGHGWIIGDHGSGARLGRHLLDRFCADPNVDDATTMGIDRLFGTADRGRLVAELHESDAPAAFLARAAPLLTAAAEHGEPWATMALDREMGALAATTAAHVSRWARPAARIGLAGGVWSSPSARLAFERAIGEAAPEASVARCSTTPLEGAVRLALERQDER